MQITGISQAVICTLLALSSYPFPSPFLPAPSLDPLAYAIPVELVLPLGKHHALVSFYWKQHAGGLLPCLLNGTASLSRSPGRQVLRAW